MMAEHCGDLTLLATGLIMAIQELPLALGTSSHLRSISSLAMFSPWRSLALERLPKK